LKILLVRFSSAGDILLCSGLIAILKNAGHRVDMLTKEKFSDAAILAGAGEVLTYRLNSVKDFFSVSEKLSASGYDIIMDLHATIRSRIITMMSHAGKKAWYAKNPVKRRLSVLFKWFLNERPVSVADRYIMAAQQAVAGILIKERKPAAPKAKVTNITLHLGARWKLKRWPHFDRLIMLLSSLKGVKVTVTGVKDEVENYAQMEYHKKRSIKDMTGRTDFKGLAGIIGKSDLFIGNDTAAAHLAVLAKVPAIVFLGPTSSTFGFITGGDFHIIENRGLLCRPCHVHGGDRCPIATFECMGGITAEAAFERIKKIITRGKNV
jgi:ADP-heptose:LPS heptosyltransferase